MTQKRLTEKRLRTSLSHYWLITEQSPMQGILDKVVQAYAHGTTLRLHLSDSNDFGMKEALDWIGVKCELYPPSESNANHPFDSLRAPPLRERAADYELILPYLIAARHKALKIETPLEQINIDICWIFLFSFLLENAVTAESIVDYYLLEMRDNSIRFYLEQHSQRNFQRLYHDLRQIPLPALWYASIAERSTDMLEFPRLDHWFNELGKKIYAKEISLYREHDIDNERFRAAFVDKGAGSLDDEFAPYGEDGKKLKSIVMEQPIAIPLVDIGIAARNLLALSGLRQTELDERAVRILTLRLQGKAEGEIKKTFGIHKKNSWSRLLSELHVNLKCLDKGLSPNKVLRLRQSAKKTLSGVSESVDVITLEMSGNPKLKGAIFRANKNGKSYSLSEKQYRVVEHALKNWNKDIAFSDFRHQLRLSEQSMNHVFKRKKDESEALLKKGSKSGTWRLNGKPQNLKRGL